MKNPIEYKEVKINELEYSSKKGMLYYFTFKSQNMSASVHEYSLQFEIETKQILKNIVVL